MSTNFGIPAGIPQAVSQAVPSSAGNATQIQSGVLDAVTKDILQQVVRPRSSLAPAVPGVNPSELQHKPMMSGPTPPGYGVQAFLYNLGASVHNAVAEHKETQVRKAMADYSAIGNAWERAQTIAGGDPNKAEQLFQKDPITQAILGDPKKMKHIAKALSMDWLNPEKTTVYGEALKRTMQADQAGKMMKVLRALHLAHQPQPQLNPQQRQQFIQQEAARLPFVPQTSDPRMVMDILQNLRLEQQHAEDMGIKKEQLDQTMKLRLEEIKDREQQAKDNLALRGQIFAATAEGKKAQLAETAQYHKEMIELRKQEIATRLSLAQSTGDPKDWAQLIRTGTPISQVPTTQKSAVIRYMHDQGWSVPRTIPASSQKILSDAVETQGKIDQWLGQLEQFKGPDGKVSNQPFSMLKQAVEYKLGINTSESQLISDMSRERWQAISPLLHGVRRGDIIRDIVQHTPNPYKDSPALMITKLQALEKNYNEARYAVLKSYGYDIDPTTGDPLVKPGGYTSNAPKPDVTSRVVPGTAKPTTASQYLKSIGIK